MMRAFRIAYDGTNYHGFQRQPDVQTVEGELFGALETLGITGGCRPEGYAAAGRTDAGVSAVAQTVGFRCPEWLSPRALNSELPASIRVWASADAPEDFHATRDATHREYTYYLHAPSAERDSVYETLFALSGPHDFHNLTPDTERTQRTLETDLETTENFFILTFRAAGFSRQLVRRAVGLTTAVADEKRDDVERVLSSERLTGPDGVHTAPPEPLVLTDVDYPMLAFCRDSDAAERAADLFEAERIKHQTQSLVAQTIRSTIRGERVDSDE